MEDKKPEYKTLNVEGVKYKTLFTVKYEARKPHKKKDLTRVTAFIPGIVSRVFVKKGAEVKAGNKLLILEAMKMKNLITSPMDGTVARINITEGKAVAKDEILVELAPEKEEVRGT
jgi:biotin carboxyl carrier protein